MMWNDDVEFEKQVWNDVEFEKQVCNQRKHQLQKSVLKSNFAWNAKGQKSFLKPVNSSWIPKVSVNAKSFSGDYFKLS